MGGEEHRPLATRGDADAVVVASAATVVVTSAGPTAYWLLLLLCLLLGGHLLLLGLLKGQRVSRDNGGTSTRGTAVAVRRTVTVSGAVSQSRAGAGGRSRGVSGHSWRNGCLNVSRRGSSPSGSCSRHDRGGHRGQAVGGRHA